MKPASSLLRVARAVLGWSALACGLFMLAGWAGSSIPRNPGWNEARQGVEIMVESNGVHTAIVMPLVSAHKDWRSHFPVSDVDAQGRPFTHISVSWGEREVFLNTPTWGDLSPLTVLRILGLGGDGLVHAQLYVRPAPSDNLRKLTLRAGEYRRLIERIEAVAPDAGTATYPGYGRNDVFYDAQGEYTATNTCNQWTSDTLAAAGIRTGWWTPFAGGVMKWAPRPGES